MTDLCACVHGPQCTATIVILCIGEMHNLINYVSFINYLSYGVTIAGLLYLRKQRPNLARPIKVQEHTSMAGTKFHLGHFFFPWPCWRHDVMLFNSFHVKTLLLTSHTSPLCHFLSVFKFLLYFEITSSYEYNLMPLCISSYLRFPNTYLESLKASSPCYPAFGLILFCSWAQTWPQPLLICNQGMIKYVLSA